MSQIESRLVCLGARYKTVKVLGQPVAGWWYRGKFVGKTPEKVLKVVESKPAK